MDVIITEEGLEALKKRLIELEKELQEESKGKMEASELGGNAWHDNPAFDEIAAKQRMLIYEIDKTKERIRNAKMVPMDAKSSQNSRVALGSLVEIKINGRETKKVRIADFLLADPSHGVISYESPLSKALLGGKAGDIRSYTVSNRKMKVEILKVDFGK